MLDIFGSFNLYNVTMSEGNLSLGPDALLFSKNGEHPFVKCISSIHRYWNTILPVTNSYYNKAKNKPVGLESIHVYMHKQRD